MIAVNPLYQSAHNYEMGIRVENALLRADPNRFRRISVVAFHGIVELTGTVAIIYEKSLAMNIAERVPGVTTVVESLRIRKIQEPSGIVAGLRRQFRRFAQEKNQRFRNHSRWNDK